MGVGRLWKDVDVLASLLLDLFRYAITPLHSPVWFRLLRLSFDIALPHPFERGFGPLPLAPVLDQ